MAGVDNDCEMIDECVIDNDCVIIAEYKASSTCSLTSMNPDINIL